MSSHGASMPAPQNYGNQLQENNAAQGGAASGYLSNMSTFGPAFTGLNTQLLGQAMGGQLGNTQGYAPGATNLLSQTQQQYVQSNPILAAIQGQGLSAAQQGGSISPEMQIALDEQSNSGFAGTGMNGSTGNLLANILNRGNYSQQRLQSNMGIAQNAQNTINGSTGGVQNLIASYLSPGTAANNVNSTGGGLFNPQSSYAQNIYDTNYNAQVAAYNSQQNNNAGLLGGILKGVGAVGLGLATGGFGFGAMGANLGAGVAGNIGGGAMVA